VHCCHSHDHKDEHVCNVAERGEKKERTIASADAMGRLALYAMTLRVRAVLPFLRRYGRRFTYDQLA